MPGQFIGSLFAGVTPSPQREFVAKVIEDMKPETVFVPCAGSFASSMAICRSGYPAERLRTSDVSLYSSLLGTLADPTRKLDDLSLTLEGPHQVFYEGFDSELDRIAGVLLALKWLTLEPKNLYLQEIRRDVKLKRAYHHAHVVKELERFLGFCAGLQYRPADVLAQIDELGSDEKAVSYINLPGVKAGYTKQYGTAEKVLGWDFLTEHEFDPARAADMLGPLTDVPALVLALRSHRQPAPEGWTAVQAVAGTHGQTDYVYANRPIERRHARQWVTTGKPRIFPIYNDETITEASVFSFLQVDRDTCLYYRDLFVHQLGTTNARKFVLGFIDGRVHTAMGLDDQHLALGHIPYLGEVYGITKSSPRYDLLNRLFMTCLHSEDFKRWFIGTNRAYGFREPLGIQTSSITRPNSPYTRRDWMQRVVLEEVDKGMRVVYRTDFIPGTWSDCVRDWLAECAHKHGDLYVCEECGWGTPDGLKPEFAPKQTAGRNKGRFAKKR